MSNTLLTWKRCSCCIHRLSTTALTVLTESRGLIFGIVHPEVHFGHCSTSHRSEYQMAGATYGLQSTRISVWDWFPKSTKGYLQISKKEKFIVCRFRVNVSQYDTDHRQAVLYQVRKEPQKCQADVPCFHHHHKRRGLKREIPYFDRRCGAWNAENVNKREGCLMK